MSSKEKFDWCDYYYLGNSYSNETNVSKLRTGINRFYYSCFLKSRDYLLDNNIFLNKNSKKIMKSNSSKIHEETRNIFKTHPKLNMSKKGKQIAEELKDLREYRNMVDYDAENPKNIKFAYSYCKSRAKKIFELLNELN